MRARKKRTREEAGHREEEVVEDIEAEEAEEGMVEQLLQPSE